MARPLKNVFFLQLPIAVYLIYLYYGLSTNKADSEAEIAFFLRWGATKSRFKTLYFLLKKSYGGRETNNLLPPLSNISKQNSHRGVHRTLA